MQQIEVPYHIIVYSAGIAQCDCLCRIPIDKASNTRLTIYNLIQIIANTLTQEKEYKEFSKYLKNNALIIRFGKAAETQQDVEWKQLIKHKEINTADFVFECDINPSYCFFILVDETEINTIKEEERQHKTKKETKHSSKTTNQSSTKSRRRRKRKRKQTSTVGIGDEEEMEIQHKPLKRSRKTPNKSASKQLESECLWLLTDASLSGQYQVESINKKKKSSVERVDLVRTCIETIVTKNWTKGHIALYSFPPLKEICAPLSHSKKNAIRIQNTFDSIGQCETRKDWNVLILDAITQLMDIIKRKNIGCGHHRIVLFLNKHGGRPSIQSLSVNEINNRLKKDNIIFDCIQVSHSHRPNSSIYEIAKEHGKFWSPGNNMKEWKAVVRCHDFVYPHKRNVAQAEAIAID